MTELEQLLQPALGYLQLGMMDDANEEIEALPPAIKNEKLVLRILVLIHSASASWKPMREVSEFLAHEWPDDSQHWIWLGFATRRCRSIAEAELILLDAVKLHPKEPMIHFNLACYAAQTGDLASARKKLARAEKLDPDVKTMALEDTDLEPLWPELGKDPTGQSP